MFGNVNKRRLRRPNESIVCHPIHKCAKIRKKRARGPTKKAGKANTQFTKPQTGQQGLLLRMHRLDKRRRRIKRDDIDPTHQLRDNDGEAGKCGASDARDGEELDEAGDIGGSTEDLEFP